MRWIVFCNILMHFLFPKAIIDADTVLRNTLVFDIQYIGLHCNNGWFTMALLITLMVDGLYISQSNWCTHICCIACCSTFKCDIDIVLPHTNGWCTYGWCTYTALSDTNGWCAPCEWQTGHTAGGDTFTYRHLDNLDKRWIALVAIYFTL